VNTTFNMSQKLDPVQSFGRNRLPVTLVSPQARGTCVFSPIGAAKLDSMTLFFICDVVGSEIR
jgi:hypothetical protein